MRIRILLAILTLCALTVHAQPPELINYQGRVIDGGSLVNGSYPVIFRLYNTLTGGTETYGETQTVQIVDGLYSAVIGASNATPGTLGVALSSLPCYLDITINGTTLTPREQLVSAAYALHAGQDWELTGNAGTTAGVDFIGTTDDEPLQLRVDGILGLSLTPTNGIVNILGGRDNVMDQSALGGIVLGGSNNLIGADSHLSIVLGGRSNVIGSSSFASTIIGGRSSTIEPFNDYCVILGGRRHDIATESDRATIVNGEDNTIGYNGNYCTILGGQNHVIGSNSTYAAILAGHDNTIGPVTPYAFIGGAQGSTIASGAVWSAILSGSANSIGTNAQSAFIGSGIFQTIGRGSLYSCIQGGSYNDIGDGSTGSNIDGGHENYIGNSNQNAVIGGGSHNEISNSTHTATISGGAGNRICSDADYTTIGGGYLNVIGTNANYATISGGQENEILANATAITIGGGFENSIGADSFYSVVGGGRQNIIGAYNDGVTIAGGSYNTIGDAAKRATIAGGVGNDIGQGATNSTISGGFGNEIGTNALSAIIAGGYGNVCSGQYTFAAGNYARAFHKGAFIWGDSQNSYVNSTTNDQVTFRCQGGVRFLSGSGGLNSEIQWTPGDASWSVTSDRNAKENFIELDAQDVLAKVGALPMTEWNYKGYEQRHIGPMAQDFHAAFGLGQSDKRIDSMDLDGIALTAIQALYQQNQQLLKKNVELEARLTALEDKSP